MSAPRPPCTRATRRCDFWNWGVGFLRPDCCTEHLQELLEFTSELLERNGIRYWLDFGTLLGAVREGAFIPWDADVDVGIHAVDRAAVCAMRADVEAAGYRFNDHVEAAIRIEYSERNAQHIDLFLWYEQGDVLASHEDPIFEWPGMHDRSTFPRHFVEPMEAIELYGRRYPVPTPTHEFLVEHRYGPDYLTPTRPILNFKLYPTIAPGELTPLAKELLAEISVKDHRLQELRTDSPLTRYRLGEVWSIAGLPVDVPQRYLDAAVEGISAADRTPVIEQLVRSKASLDHAIDELEHGSTLLPLRRAYRRGVRAKELAAALLRRRPHEASFPFGVAGEGAEERMKDRTARLDSPVG